MILEIKQVNKKMGDRKKFVSYKNDDDQVVSGYFLVIEESNSFIKIKTHNNIVTLPYHRIIKIKEDLK